jgi:hypothetical protein
MTSCIDVVDNMIKSIDAVNTEIISNMIDPAVKYEDVCIKPNLTFEYYFSSLKSRWEKIINQYIDMPDKCPGYLQSLLFMYELGNALKKNLAPGIRSKQSIVAQIENLSPQQVEKFVHDKMIDEVINMITGTQSPKFVMEPDMIKTVKNLALILGENCQCQMIDIYIYVTGKYRSRYAKKIAGKSREETVRIIEEDYDHIKNTLLAYGKNINPNPGSKNIVPGISGPGTSGPGTPGPGTSGPGTPGPGVPDPGVPASGVSGVPVDHVIVNFSIDNELNKLIPDDLGTIKIFFVKVISRYFNNLHPIIWAQIFRGMINNVFKDLPATPDEWFSFVSKYLLLNSGPFILKILQMIRPVLSDEQAAKYNLTKLTYPLLEPNQIELILKQILINYDMTKIIYNKSASVGHVCIGYDVRRPDDMFVVKIIKPLAIAQSCWEFSVLTSPINGSYLFPTGGCADSFVKNTLRSNGAEMNVANEISHLDQSHEMYTATYEQEFGLNVDARLTTIEHKPNIVKPGTWFALAMTLAPGKPLSELIEMKELEKDTIFRANLHRCLDILVSRFFYVLVKSGFYHGDLHSGNIFYSFKKKQITLIDFGAMGTIDLWSGDTTTSKLLTVIIMSVNYDFDNILDILTDLLNSKCSDDPDAGAMVDKNSDAYQKFKTELIAHKIKNTLNYEKESKKAAKYLSDTASDKRLTDEQPIDLPVQDETIADKDKETANPSIYDYLDRVPDTKETVVENRDILPVFTDVVGDSESISFAKVMELIIKFYAASNVNVALKFSELNELQKAYALLLGVLAKTGYSSYRMSMAIRTGILNWGLLPKIVNVGTTYDVLATYWDESNKYKSFKSFIVDQRQKYLAGKISKSMNPRSR